MKKIIAILLAGMMTATAFAGCGGSTESSNASSGSGSASGSNAATVDKATVDYGFFGDEDNIKLTVWAPDATVSLVKKQVEEFKKIYSEKKIDITVKPQGEDTAAANIQQDPDAAADVFGFANDQLQRLVSAGVLSPVNAKFKEFVVSSNTKESINGSTAKNKDGEDTLYAYPETNNGYCMVYDNTVVTEEDAKTLEGTLEACKKANKKFIFDAGTGFYSATFVFTAGAKVDGFETDEDDNLVQKFVDYDEDEAVKTLQAFGKLIKKYKGTFTSLAVSKIASGFENGTCGAGVDGPWDTSANKKALGEKFGAAKLPTINVDGTDKQLISVYGYKCLGVNVASKFPKTSQILALYLAGEDCQKQRAQEIDWVPTNSNLQNDEIVTSDAFSKAMIEQAAFSCDQKDTITQLYSPMQTLGNNLVSDKFNPDDTAAIKQSLEKALSNVNGGE